MNEAIKTGVDQFLIDAQALIDMKRNTNSNIPRYVLSIEPGKKYLRIVCGDGFQRSAFCFIDSTNGDILKSASWKAPAKGSRGNVLNYNDIGECISEYGAKYLK